MEDHAPTASLQPLVYYILSRDIVEIILKTTDQKDWKDEQIFSKKTLPLLVEKMPGEDNHAVCNLDMQ